MTTKPCGHNEPNQYVEGCSICRVHATNDEYNRRWNGTGVKLSRGPCRHLGAETRRILCGTCRGKVELKVFACAKFGECTKRNHVPGVQGCCADNFCYEMPDPFGGEIVRNLLYHIYPRSGNGVWQWNVEQLLKRIQLFNGRRIVAVAVDDSTDPADSVREAFAGHATEFIEVRNSPCLREVATFAELFSRVETTNPHHVTLYGQAKGVTYCGDHRWMRSVRLWTEMLYEICLDYWPLVEQRLRQFPLTGPFWRDGDNFPANTTAGEWMYFGSWWWFRNKDLFEKADWRRIDRVWFGIEPYNALHYRPEEADRLFHPGWAPSMDPYNLLYLQGRVVPDLERFREKHAEERTRRE